MNGVNRNTEMESSRNAVGLWFFTDFGQFYICDPDTESDTSSPDFWNNEAFGRSIAASEGIIGVGVSDFGLVRGLFQIFGSEPNIPTEAWDNIAEASITTRSGRIQIIDCPSSGVQHEWSLPAGDYRVRVYSALYHLTPQDYKRINENLDAMSSSGPDFYWVCLWPAEFSPPIHLKGLKRKSG